MMLSLRARAQTFREETILPAATDPAITQWTAGHVAIVNTAAPFRTHLFLFMHGAGGTGQGAKDLMRTAAAEGFRAIGLTYPNDWVPFTYCASADSDCYENLRLEIINGVDRSAHINVGPVDSVDNRVVKLLAHLDQLHPGEGWGQFLTGSPATPVWSRIIVWGHSQGGANVSVLARHRVLAGACLSGQATDFVGSQPAAWWSSHATPTARYFGLCHTQDQLSAKITVWDRQGLDDFGPVQDIASASPPFAQTHQLSTTLSPAISGQYHNSVVIDNVTPRDAQSRPLNAPAWRYMILGAAAASPCPADFDASGSAAVPDIFSFLTAWFALDVRADINHVGGVTIQDVFAFLTAWFGGC